MGKSIDEAFEDIVSELSSRIKRDGVRKAAQRRVNAARRIADRLHSEMNRIKSDAVNEYYSGYEPELYERTDNIKEGILPIVEVRLDGNKIKFKYKIDVDDELLDHSVTTFKNRSIHINKGAGAKHPVNNEIVMDNFLAGIHPNATSAWTNGDIEQLVKSEIGVINNSVGPAIIREELSES